MYDVRGAVTRSSTSSTGSVCTLTVAPYQLDTSNLAAAITNLGAQSAAMLNNSLGAGDTASLLNSLRVLSSVISTPVDLCAQMACGNGSCFSGVCLCNTGYTGSRCEVAPVPVDGAYSDWSSWSGCSASCGGGASVRTRSCLPPLFGGAPYVVTARLVCPCVSLQCSHRDFVVESVLRCISSVSTCVCARQVLCAGSVQRDRDVQHRPLCGDCGRRLERLGGLGRVLKQMSWRRRGQLHRRARSHTRLRQSAAESRRRAMRWLCRGLGALQH